MDMWDLERVGLAKRHFGNPLRLQVAEWVLTDGVDKAFKQQEVVDGVRAVTKSTSAVPTHLAQFVSDGMLQRIRTESGNVYYSYIEHPLWGAYVAVLESLRSAQSADR